MSVIKDMVFGNDDAAKAAEKGSELSAAGQERALEYTMQQERMPTAYRDQAMSQLGMLYGLPGLGGSVPYGNAGQPQPQQVVQQPPANANYMVQNPAYDPNQGQYMAGDQGYTGQQVPQYISAGQLAQPQPQQNIQMQQQDGGGYSPMDKAAFVEALSQDPFYQSMLDQGEQAVLRGSSATGGLRSGTASENLAQNSQNVLQGYYNQQVQGLQGMMGMPSNTNAIAKQMAGIGNTYGQGAIASGQASADSSQNQMNTLMGIGGLGLSAYGAGMFGGGGASAASGGFVPSAGVGSSASFNYSDRRLKESIEPSGERNGHKWHTWTWNKEAERLGFFGDSEGVIADEVAQTHPEVIGNSNGYLTVNYQALGVM